MLYDRYQVPLMVAESGVGAFDELAEEAGEKRVHDQCRIDYLRQHVHAMELAINNGVDLWGYTPWGCVDLVSMGTPNAESRECRHAKRENLGIRPRQVRKAKEIAPLVELDPPGGAGPRRWSHSWT